MISKLDESVSVSLAFDGVKKTIAPKVLIWKGRFYLIRKVGLHHKFRQGRTLFHVFSVASRTSFFRLVLNTDTLHWKLEGVSDNLAN